MSTTPDVETIVQQVLAKKKYHFIDIDLVTFIASTEAKKRTTLKEAVKATTNKLHQVAWAYFKEPPAYASYLQDLELLPDNISDDQSRQFCLKLMQEHASTHERLPILKAFYTTLFADIQPISSILDLACGFNPLAFPWMALEKDTRYYASDIFADMSAFLTSFFQHFHIAGEAQVCNLLTHTPQEKVKVALLLKTLPCLEQAEKESARRILSAIHAQYLIVSFPVRSIGGREKGMLAHYSAQFESLLDDLGWRYQKFLFESELAYRVEKEKH